MIEFMEVMVYVLMIEGAICVYALIRNNWVHRQRVSLIWADFKAYQKLPSYEEMLAGHGFWRWDMKYYLR